MTTVDTYRVVRRCRVGDGFRENGELIPEAHTWFAVEHYLHTGELEEAPDVDETEFVAAVDTFCPELAADILARLGIDPPAQLGSNTHASPRSAPLLPPAMPARANPKTVRVPKKLVRATPRPAAAKQPETTIVPTDVPPGAPTPEPPAPVA